jgi:hypothetical protein
MIKPQEIINSKFTIKIEMGLSKKMYLIDVKIKFMICISQKVEKFCRGHHLNFRMGQLCFKDLFGKISHVYSQSKKKLD